MIATETENLTTIRPHPGPQEIFLATPADYAIYGGAAGGGKTWSLLMQPMYHIGNPRFGAVIFRHTSKQVHNEGGLWDQSAELYPKLAAEAVEYKSQWKFPSGAKVTFDHMEHEKDKYNWDGSQLAMIGLDELTHFTESQFWYITSRSRSISGVRPYIRATCNPDADSWVAGLVSWWIDQTTGFPIPERSGVIRWFVRIDNRLEWADSPAELKRLYPKSRPRSLTFIAAKLEDNPTLERVNPDYRANLEALPLVDRERLLSGNWKIRPTVGNFFRRPWFQLCNAIPSQGRAVRYWDKAGSTKDGDFSAGVLLHEYDGMFYIADVIKGRWTPNERNQVMAQQAEMDVLKYGLSRLDLWIEQEPGSNALESSAILSRHLAKFAPRFDKKRVDKETRAKPLSAACEAGLVYVLNAPWTREFLDELCSFPNPKVHDDQVDAVSGAFAKLLGETESHRPVSAAPRGKRAAHAR